MSRCALAPAPPVRRRRNRKQHLKTTSTNRQQNKDFSYFFRAGKPCSKNAPKITSRGLSGTLPGPPGRVKSINFWFQEVPRGHTMIFFAPRRRPGRHQERFRTPPWAHMAARSAPETSQSSFWTSRKPSRFFSPTFHDFRVSLACSCSLVVFGAASKP